MIKFKIKTFIIILVSATSIISCGEQNLGNNYYYLSKDESIDIGYPYGSIIYKSSKKNAFQNVKIFADVAEVAHNNKYIIALQQPNRDALARLLKSDILFWSKHFSKNGKDSIVSIAGKKMSLKNIHDLFGENEVTALDHKIQKMINDSLFRGISFERNENFYIINKVDDSVIGPLDKSHFSTLVAAMKIDLKF